MKKFTFLLLFFMITLMASTQNKESLQMKIQQVYEKFSKISQRTTLLTKISEKLTLNSESLLKSVAATQHLDSIVDRDLDVATQIWQNGSKEEFLYDSEMKNTSMLSKEWDVNAKTWVSWTKTELGYDNNKQVNSMLMYDKDSLNQALILSTNLLVFYNGEGMQDSTLIFSTKNAGVSWVLDMKQINNYNASKQLIKSEMWVIDEEVGGLTHGIDMIYTYTASGKINTSSTVYIMDGEEMVWAKTEYYYDGSGKLTSNENWELSFTTFVLDKSSRSTYQYNASNDVSVEIYSNWNGTAWIDIEKDENIYSTTNFSDIIFPVYFYLYGGNERTGLTYSKAISSTNSFEMANGSWLNTGKSVYYYSDGSSTNINEFENSLVTVFPNPASDWITFTWNGTNEGLSLKMFQITGVKVYDQQIYSGKVFLVSHLADGVYIYKLYNGQKMVHTGKLIKK